MSNSSIINDIKAKVITEIVNDESLFHAINSPDINNFSDSDRLINTHLFRYHQNPETITKAITFLTFQVHTSKPTNDVFVKPELEIWIISNEKCMSVNNIPKITANRNDYISQLLDIRFNGRTSLGDGNNKINLLGKLDLISNIEGAFSSTSLYRKMVFVTKDINNSMCNEW